MPDENALILAAGRCHSSNV